MTTVKGRRYCGKTFADMCAEGMTTRQIADWFAVTPESIKAHLRTREEHLVAQEELRRVKLMPIRERLGVKVSQLGMPHRVRKSLGHMSIEEVLAHDIKSISAGRRGLGRGSLHELRERLAELGFAWGGGRHARLPIGARGDED